MGNNESSPSPPPSPEVISERDDVDSQNYDSIRRRCKNRGTLWEDPMFPAITKTIYFDGIERFPVEWLRPLEICRRLTRSCRFYVKGPSRFDLIQGDLGDCWVLASLAALAERQDLIENVIPDHRFFMTYSGFDASTGYCGVFRFRFYHFGKWQDICVDDRIPTFNGRPIMVHSATPNEFWGALVEKAYAKLFGCYEALKGGVCSDALTDLTGGVCENYRLKRYVPSNLNLLLETAVRRGSLCCTGIWGDASNNQVLPNGLVTGHAYTITDVERLYQSNGQRIFLIRIRNPWGNKTEWKGKWGDRSLVWQYVPERVKKELDHRLRDDGEFWMDYNDFIATFDDVDICHLKPDSLTFTDSFALNPQYALSLMDATDDNDKVASILVELSQKHRRKTKEPNLNIGFVIYEVLPNSSLPLPYSYFLRNDRAGAVDYYTNLRTVAKRFTLKPGNYVIVPSTWDPGQEAKFVIRIWSEVEHKARLESTPRIVDSANETDRSLTEEEDDQTYRSVYRIDPFMTEEAAKFFRAVSGEDMVLTAYELQTGLNKLYSNAPRFQFDIDCCKALISNYDINHIHKLEWKQFLPLYRFLNLSANVFAQNDHDWDGYLNRAEFIMALKRQNYGSVVTIDDDKYENGRVSLSSDLEFAFSDQKGLISFSSYVHAVTKLERAKVGFENHKEKHRNVVKMSRSEFVQAIIQP